MAAVGIDAAAVSLDAVEAELGVLGCDALFAAGAFVNRRGSAALIDRLAPRAVLVLGERWKEVGGPAPVAWPRPELFEVVAPRAGVEVLR